jgi:hypothetical protein
VRAAGLALVTAGLVLPIALVAAPSLVERNHNRTLRSGPYRVSEAARTLHGRLVVADLPVVVSHTGVKATCDNARNLSDAQLRGVAGRAA